jgi:hypothetical protein
MSKHKATIAAAGGLQQQEQPGSSTGLGMGMDFKSEAGGFDLKPGPGLKVEGIKVDPGLKADPDLKQVRRQVVIGRGVDPDVLDACRFERCRSYFRPLKIPALPLQRLRSSALIATTQSGQPMGC